MMISNKKNVVTLLQLPWSLWLPHPITPHHLPTTKGNNVKTHPPEIPFNSFTKSFPVPPCHTHHLPPISMIFLLFTTTQSSNAFNNNHRNNNNDGEEKCKPSQRSLKHVNSRIKTVTFGKTMAIPPNERQVAKVFITSVPIVTR